MNTIGKMRAIGLTVAVLTVAVWAAQQVQEFKLSVLAGLGLLVLL